MAKNSGGRTDVRAVLLSTMFAAYIFYYSDFFFAV
jgi:hypothetical protein